ncbi:MAG: DNA-directed RNA polymerase subunit M [Eubacterium sp.]|nr:DNA-directed RNA polymerase subunit M [Eubacterium sp.]
MLKIYICSDCGWLRTVSRRKEVECHRCGNPSMELTRLDYEKYVEMNEQEREDYVQSWRYIHRTSI